MNKMKGCDFGTRSEKFLTLITSLTYEENYTRNETVRNKERGVLEHFAATVKTERERKRKSKEKI